MTDIIAAIIVVALVLTPFIIYFAARRSINKLRKTLLEKETALANSEQQLDTLTQRYAHVIDLDKTLDERRQEIITQKNELTALNDKYQGALKVYHDLEQQVKLYENNLEIIEYGLYKPVFDYTTSEQYKQQLEQNYDAQKALVKNDGAVVCPIEWEVSGSKAEGRKMTDKYKKLMLFAFNGECDGLIAKVKWNNATRIQERIRKSFDSINKLGASTKVSLTDAFLDLKLKELALTYELEQKLYEEKEEQRVIREQMREEEKAQKELERAQREAEDEEKRYQRAIEKVQKELGYAKNEEIEVLNHQMQFLQQQLEEAHQKKERALSMAQLTKVGHIYVISNIGSFGENVYKIGMTRRLDPADRVKELGDASVPFSFDVHAIIYSENAPQLERELHVQFAGRRLNRINQKKEFFRVTLDEIETFVNQHAGAEIAFTKMAEAREYRETLTMLQQLEQQSTTIVEAQLFPSSLM